MQEFDSLEKVKELFKSVGCEGKENCYFVTYKDFQKSSGMVNGMEYPYYGLLINQTEDGLGVFFLNQEKFSLQVLISNLKVVKDSYFFIKNDDIDKIEVKNFAIFNTKTKRITIKLKDRKVHRLYAYVSEKTIPYHEENFTKFLNKYAK